MSLRRRVVACLDVDEGRVVKGRRFAALVDAGDPVARAELYAREGADEIVILDIGATRQERPVLLELISRAAARLDVPLAVGGGVRSYDDAAALLDAGADKVSVNSAAVTEPELIGRISARLGAQSLIVAIDAMRSGAGWKVRSVAGTRSTGRDAIAWAREAADRGAGEILLTSIDRDGTGDGYDLELTRAVADAVRVPVICSGGAGTVEHIVEGLTVGRASAALVASLLHFDRLALPQIKATLAERGVAVRLPAAPPAPAEVPAWLA